MRSLRSLYTKIHIDFITSEDSGDRPRDRPLCVTVIETAQVFSNLNIIESVKMINERCFSHTLVAIKPRNDRKPLFDHEKEVLLSQLSLIEEVYTEKFWNTLAFAFLSDSQEGDEKYSVFYRFRQTKFDYASSILSLSQFVLLPRLLL